jgi:hypothetical protein
MDPNNLFLTRRTYWLARLDYLAILAVLLGLLWAQRAELNWWHFFFAIAWQDVVGYYPAAAVHFWPRRYGGSGAVPRWMYVLYNVIHGIPLNAAVLLAWLWIAGGWQPAMLAIPIHLCIDRGVLGRFYKSFSIAFESVPHPEYARFAARMAQQPAHWPGSDAADAAPAAGERRRPA